MTFPPGLPVREVGIGGGAVLEDGTPLQLRITTTASRSLVRDATGFRFQSVYSTATAAAGEEVVFVLPVTDASGWRDADSQLLIDVSAPNSYTHRYTSVVEMVLGSKTVGKKFTIGPYIVPAGETRLDLDKMLAVGTTTGTTVLMPDVWSALVASAEDAALNAAASAAAVAASTADAEAYAVTIVDAATIAAVAAQDIPGKVSAAVAAAPTVTAAAASAASTAVTNEIAGRSLVERFNVDPFAPWRWAHVYETGEVAIGERTDGTLYPDFLNPSQAELSVVNMEPTRGWRWAIYFAANDEVAFGQRTDGTFYPDFTTPEVVPDTVRISGDSLTGGWAGASATALGVLLGHPVVAQGDGGRRSDWIAARQGGQPLRVTSSTGVIPASGALNVTVAAYNHIGTTAATVDGSSMQGVLGGVFGTLVTSDNGNGVFTRVAPGREVVLPAGSPFQRMEYRSAWPIIWAGRNNFKLANDGAQIIRDVGDMLRWTSRRDRALVLSIPPWEGEEIGSGIRGTLDSVNAMLRDNFPAEFYDSSALLRSEAMLNAVGVTPTATDIANIASGLTPASFRIDAGHLSAKGYEALNLVIKEAYAARGWI